MKIDGVSDETSDSVTITKLERRMNETDCCLRAGYDLERTSKSGGR